MRVPSEEAFTLSKVKVISGGGLDVHYEVEEICGAEVYRENYHLASSKEIHPDLQKKLDNLKPILARVFHLSFFKTLMDMPEFKATAKQKDLANKEFENILKKIRVTGVSLSGKDDNVGVVITGVFEADTKQVIAINTHRIKFVSDTYGFELELEKNVGELEKEVYAFLFKNKKAQLELFPENLEDEDMEQKTE